jgi:hypothetical protein
MNVTLISVVSITLRLVNQPKPPDNEYGVLLTGQNGHITSTWSHSLSGGPLSRITRPHVYIVTKLLSTLEYFKLLPKF